MIGDEQESKQMTSISRRRFEQAGAAAAALPLAGRTVAVVHAAWQSCGSYQVNVSQAAVYRDLGAHVISLAVREWPPGQSDLGSARWRDWRWQYRKDSHG